MRKRTDFALEKTKGLSLSEMSPMQKEWAEKREQRRKTLEARVAQEESEAAQRQNQI